MELSSYKLWVGLLPSYSTSNTEVTGDSLDC